MKMRRVGWAGILLAVTGNAWALPASSGGSGLVVSRTAEMTPAGTIQVSPFYLFTLRAIPASARYPVASRSQSVFETTLDYGVSDSVEVALLVPVGWDELQYRGGASAPGVQGNAIRSAGFSTIEGIAKVRAARYVEPSEDSFLRSAELAFAAYGGASPKDAHGLVGSGQPSGGVEALGSFFFGRQADPTGSSASRTAFHLMVGFEGANYFSDVVPTQGLKAKPRLKGSIGVSYVATPMLEGLLELNGGSVLGVHTGPDEMVPLGDEDLYAVAGARLAPARGILLTLGGGAGIPGGVESDTTFLVVGGASVLFGSSVVRPRPAP